MKKKYMFFDIDGTLTDNATKKLFPVPKRRWTDCRRQDILSQSPQEELTIKQGALWKLRVCITWYAAEGTVW